MNMVVDIIVSVALYKPLGIAGLVIGTAVANAVMTALQLHRLRIGFNGRLEGGQTLMITARILVASAIMAAVALGRVDGARQRCSARSLLGQIVSVGLARRGRRSRSTRRLVLVMRIPEARQIEGLVRGACAGSRLYQRHFGARGFAGRRRASRHDRRSHSTPQDLRHLRHSSLPRLPGRAVEGRVTRPASERPGQWRAPAGRSRFADPALAGGYGGLRPEAAATRRPGARRRSYP